ncbi:antiviral reverse transcriptase Drt3b [Burkholderia glumae]|uniref:antiviral reverse transcriptase Drt3b n=1 Tax=Burkholderia glumae TaxID=337 RepID=UPI0021515B89|nr:antiviral reverse transcriptase Drt3b [Burkholderia glumae]
MRKKIDVDKKDKYRVLHTELLPYEVPLFFSNDYLYLIAKSGEFDAAPDLIKNILAGNRYTIPFEYSIRHGAQGNRTVAVMHPATQLEFVEFYNAYDQMLLSTCGRSEFSLRTPFRVASHFIDRNLALRDNELNDGDVDSDAGGEEVSKYASSYFSYEKYSQLHKFIDSQEFLSLEAKFSSFLKFDIKKCFASIYTHTVAWAVKNKEFAKSNRQRSFEQEFDKLMMHCNYDETNGIIIGPEVSRIFAEIILQRIDLNIAKSLTDSSYTPGSYAIRRYIDDYFVFSNSENTLKGIFEIAQRELQAYKLYINESKTLQLDRPFLTPETAAKSAVQDILAETVLGWLRTLRQFLAAREPAEFLPRSVQLQLSAPFRVTTRIARDLKVAVKQSNADFSAVTGYALGALAKEIWRLRRHLVMSDLEPEQADVVGNLLIVTVEILVFFLSMDFRVRPATRVAQCMVMLASMTKGSHELNANITERFARQANQLLISRSVDRPGGVEAHNLLATISVVRPDIRLTSDELVMVIAGTESAKSHGTYDGFSYFDIVSTLFYIRDNEIFRHLKSNIEAEIQRRYETSTSLSQRADLCMLFMDLLRCPWISDATKRKIISISFRKIKNRHPMESEIGQIKNFVQDKLGFVDWNGDLHFERILNRKELKVVYDM